jgi:hypothetical protein
MIGAARFAAEHNTPSYGLVSRFRLRRGEDTGVFPRFAQVSLTQRTEGEDIVDEEDLGLTTVSVTTNIYAGKLILTDRLLRQNVATNWQTVGRQLGNGYKRIRETEIQGLFTGLNGGTQYGAAGAAFSAANVTAIVSTAKTNLVGEDLVMMHHPNAVMRLARDLTTVGSGQIRPLPEGFSARMLGKAWKGVSIWDVPVFESGLLTRDASDDASGVIMDKDAIGFLEEVPFQTKKEEDISIAGGGWEFVAQSEFAAFEYDDTKGVSLLYDAVNPATS